MPSPLSTFICHWWTCHTYNRSLTPVYFKAMDLYYDGNWSPKQVKLIVKVIYCFGSKVFILLFYFHRRRPIKEFLLDSVTNAPIPLGRNYGGSIIYPFMKKKKIVFRIRIQIGSGFNQVSGSGSRRAKLTHKSRKIFRNFMFWNARCSLLRAEGFFCSLDVLFGA